MSKILAVYSAEPIFPPHDQHPDAARYHIGEFWIDALDGEPTSDEIEALTNPPEVKRLKDFNDDTAQKDLLDKLRNATPTQIDNWIDQHDTKAALKAVIKFLIAKRLF